jgi:uncharacterized protein (TIGR00303 family)
MHEPSTSVRDGLLRALYPEAERFLDRLGGRPLFACTVAHTETAEIPGISAAGETPEKRRYTAALDAEFLLAGRPLSLPEIPKNPLGPPSPVVISRAALGALGCEPLIIDAGTALAPRVPRLLLGGAPGRCITTGAALTLSERFLENARTVGRFLAAQAPWLILAESVPGGTTTALSLLEGLGIPAGGRVSSSIAGGNHELKADVVARALSAARLPARPAALEVAAAVGDPMQPAVAVMALEASLRVPVVLGGGTQMAAVAALARRLVEEGWAGRLENVALATTRWVEEDPSADLTGLLGEFGRLPAFSAGLSFANSELPALRSYEDGLVKEGVGAGAAAFAAFLSGEVSHARLVSLIEEIVLGLPS